jgi:hypothetical protein
LISSAEVKRAVHSQTNPSEYDLHTVAVEQSELARWIAARSQWIGFRLSRVESEVLAKEILQLGVARSLFQFIADKPKSKDGAMYLAININDAK